MLVLLEYFKIFVCHPTHSLSHVRAWLFCGFVWMKNKKIDRTMASNSNDKETMTKPKVKMQDQACQFDSSLLEGSTMYICFISARYCPKTKVVLPYLSLK